MKNITKLSLFIVALFLISCAPKTDELIIGSWTFENIEILNHDELVEQQIKVSKIQIEKDIESLKKQIEESQDETTNEVLEASLIQYKAALENLPAKAEEAKEMVKKQFDAIIGKATMTFSEDNSYERKLNESDLATGNWKLSEDKKSIIISEELEGVKNEVTYTLEEVSENKLVLLLTEEEGDLKMEMKMELKK